MNRRIISLILALFLLAGVSTASAAAGDADDPLVSLSYIKNSFNSAFVEKAVNSAKATLQSTYDTALAAAQSSGAKKASGPQKYVIASGGTASLSTGDMITLLSGAAAFEIKSGAVVNVTTGTEATGALTPYSRYIACEDTSLTVRFTASSVVMAEGAVTVTGATTVLTSPFTDVATSSWYYTDVINAWSKGLINGMTATTYQPDSPLTVAQAIKLAACMNQLYGDGSVSLTNSPTASIWYMNYVTYAITRGIIGAGYASYSREQYNAPISRREFVAIFYSSLPESEYAGINSVADGAIPDVKPGSEYADEIYAFYRAGILVGDAATATVPAGTFRPSDSIKRSEVATIMSRMFDSTARKPITLS